MLTCGTKLVVQQANVGFATLDTTLMVMGGFIALLAAIRAISMLADLASALKDEATIRYYRIAV